MSILVHSVMDGGNIECTSLEDIRNIRLRIRRDKDSDFYQWFYFRLAGAKGKSCRMVIENASGSAYPGGWPGYRACASYDRETWFRVPTQYENGELVITHAPECDLAYYAYFAPYTVERHDDFVAGVAASGLAACRSLGSTLDGRSLDCLSLAGEGRGRPVIWAIARQHPGETMAEWWMEGFAGRLLDESDPAARALRQQADIHIVPNMNPDGSFRGHLRTNAAGVNLNREWDKASLERSPEVFHVLRAMDETGVDLCIDVHGDETLPYNFIAGCEGIPGFTGRQEALLEAYKAALLRASPDFQTVHGYPRNKPGEANMGIAGNAVAARHDCLAMTLEMPFKDNADMPDEAFGWSPDRCRHLGAANVDAMLAVAGDLRA